MTDDVARFEELRSILGEARELPGAERAAFLDERCGRDAELRREAEELLAAHDREAADVFSDSGLDASRRAVEELVSGDDVAWLPERIAGYRVLRRIGQGGMGIVYEAEQESPRRHVAIKLLRPQEITGSRNKRFRQEAELLGRLQHPGIARILEAGTFDLGQGEQPFFAMELVEGVDVRFYADRERLGVRERLALLAKIADAVHHAHERGIVHRDLKPDNVLVDALGQPKVLDFGVARAEESTDVISTLLTQEGVLLGTLPYMAPEQLRGESVTARTDVYALGVLAFELLTGRMPHEIGGLQVPAAMRVLEDEPRRSLGAVAPDLRGDVETMVGAALASEPEKRYETALAFASDLRRYLEDMPIEARPPSRLYRLRKYARRNRSLVGIAVVSFIAAILSTWLAAYALRKGAEAEFAEYSSGMEAAGAALERHDPAAARGILESLPPSQRGWSWRVAMATTSPAPYRVLANVGRNVEALAVCEESQILYVDRGTFLRALDLATGQELWQREFESSPRPRTVAAGDAHTLIVDQDGFVTGVSPDGRRVWRHETEGWTTGRSKSRPSLIAIPSSTEARITLVRADSGEIVAEPSVPDVLLTEHGLQPAPIRSCQVTPDGRVVLVGRADVLEVFEFDGGQLHPVGAGRGLGRLGPLVVGGGDWVAASPEFGRVRVWELPSGDVATDLRLSLSSLTRSMVFSPDDSRLLVLGGNWMYETDTWQIAHAPSLDETRHAVFLEDGRLVSLHRDGEIRLRDADAADAYVAGEHDGFAYAVSTSPDGRVYSAGWDEGKGAIRVWDAASGTRVAALAFDGAEVRDLDVSPDGRLLAVAERLVTRDGAVKRPATGMHLRVLDTRTGSEVWRASGDFIGVAFDPTGERVAAIGRDGFLLLENGVRRDAPRIRSWGHNVSWGHRPDRLVVHSVDSIELLDLESFSPVAQRLVGSVDSVALSPDGSTVVASTGTGRALLLDPDGSTVVASSSGRVLLLDAETMALRGEWVAHTGAALCAEFSPDGTLIATGGRDGVLRIWDVATLRPVGRLPGHRAYVRDVAWSRDGETLWSASGDGTVRMWTPLTRSEMAEEKREYERLVAKVEPEVVSVLANASDPDSAAEVLEGREDWGDREREVALQVLLREVVE